MHSKTLIITLLVAGTLAGCAGSAPTDTFEGTVDEPLAGNAAPPFTGTASPAPTAADPSPSPEMSTPATTPSPTPEAPTPTTTPTPSPPPSTLGKPEMGVISASTYRDTIGSLWIFGEVQNNGTAPGAFTTVSVTFYRADGSVFTSQTTYSDRQVIPVGDRSPFSTLVDDEAAEIADYKIQVTSQRTPQQAPTGSDILELKGVNTRVEDEQFYHVVGEIENTGTKTARFVEIIVALYDASGTVIGVETTYAQPPDIAAGMSSGFDAYYNLAEQGNPARYEVWVEAGSLEDPE